MKLKKLKIILPFLAGGAFLLLAGCQEQRDPWEQEPQWQQQPQQEPMQQQQQPMEQQQQPVQPQDQQIQPQQEQHQQQPDDQFGAATTDDAQRQQYVTQGQQQIAELENAMRDLQQIASQLQIESEFEPYYEELSAGLQVAREHLSQLQQADGAQLENAVSELASSINNLVDTYNEAAAVIQENLPSEGPAQGPAVH